MGTRTLYVADEDERVWKEAAALGDASVSKLVTEGLRYVIAERRVAEVENEEGSVGHSVTIDRPEYTTIINRLRQLLRRYGWQRVGLAFTEACIREGAARSRAKRRAEETLGAEGRRVAAQRAHETKGVEGRKAAARKAWAKRKAAKA